MILLVVARLCRSDILRFTCGSDDLVDMKSEVEGLRVGTGIPTKIGTGPYLQGVGQLGAHTSTPTHISNLP